MKKTIQISLLIAVALIIIKVTNQGKNLTVHAEADVIATTSQAKPFLSTLSYPQKAYLGTVEYCESRGRAEITILDTNNEYSYGILQFQLPTFINYGIKYGVLPATTTEASALAIIHDPEIQERIGTRMLADGLKSNWYTCTLRMDEYPLSPQKDLQE